MPKVRRTKARRRRLPQTIKAGTIVRTGRDDCPFGIIMERNRRGLGYSVVLVDRVPTARTTPRYADYHRGDYTSKHVTDHPPVAHPWASSMFPNCSAKMEADLRKWIADANDPERVEDPEDSEIFARLMQNSRGWTADGYIPQDYREVLTELPYDGDSGECIVIRREGKRVYIGTLANTDLLKAYDLAESDIAYHAEEQYGD